MATPLPDLTCDVCAAPAVGVAGSMLGPCSYAYCATCAMYRCEPYDMTVSVVASAIGARDLRDLAEWFHRVLFATLLRAGKTAEQFWAEVQAERAAEEAEMAGGAS
jgi:hypothetical protein